MPNQTIPARFSRTVEAGSSPPYVGSDGYGVCSQQYMEKLKTDSCFDVPR